MTHPKTSTTSPCLRAGSWGMRSPFAAKRIHGQRSVAGLPRLVVMGFLNQQPQGSVVDHKLSAHDSLIPLITILELDGAVNETTDRLRGIVGPDAQGPVSYPWFHVPPRVRRH